MPFLPKSKRRAYLPKVVRQPTSDQKLYNSKQWRKTRERYKQENGTICEACKYAGIDSPESHICDTDHIIPVVHGGDPLDERNLNRLCSAGESHHHRKSQIEGKQGKPLIEAVKNERGYLIPLNKSDLWELLTK